MAGYILWVISDLSFISRYRHLSSSSCAALPIEFIPSTFWECSMTQWPPFCCILQLICFLPTDGHLAVCSSGKKSFLDLCYYNTVKPVLSSQSCKWLLKAGCGSTQVNFLLKWTPGVSKYWPLNRDGCLASVTINTDFTVLLHWRNRWSGCHSFYFF